MDSKATAHWEGGLKDGAGRVTTASKSLDHAQVTFKARFEGKPGPTPEEMIAAAHASCFSMALSAELGRDGVTPERISTEATVTLAQVDGGFSVTRSHLQVSAHISGADEATFLAAAERAKKGCPISKLLNAEITMSAALEH